jgi:hypothetical protein
MVLKVLRREYDDLEAPRLVNMPPDGHLSDGRNSRTWVNLEKKGNVL